MALSDAEQLALGQCATDLRTSDPRLYSALRRHRLPRRRIQVWPAAVTVVVLVLIGLGIGAGAPLWPVVMWVALMTLGAVLTWWNPDRFDTGQD